MAPVVQSCCLIWCRLVRSRDFSAPVAARLEAFDRNETAVNAEATTVTTALRLALRASSPARQVNPPFGATHEKYGNELPIEATTGRSHTAGTTPYRLHT